MARTELGNSLFADDVPSDRLDAIYYWMGLYADPEKVFTPVCLNDWALKQGYVKQLSTRQLETISQILNAPQNTLYVCPVGSLEEFLALGRSLARPDIHYIEPWTFTNAGTDGLYLSYSSIIFNRDTLLTMEEKAKYDCARDLRSKNNQDDEIPF